MRFLICSVLLMAYAASARAEIYECVDGSGNKRFTNVKAEAAGCKSMNLPTGSTVPAPKPGAVKPGDTRSATPGTFPKVDPSTQQQRDAGRRKILEQELANEEQLLEQAKKDLAEQESTRLGNERNYQKYVDRTADLKASIARKESDVAAIKRELSKVPP
jgi:hypothetical protein